VINKKYNKYKNKQKGLKGFYRGWLPALVQKIPSYALTWMFFQQLKIVFFFFSYFYFLLFV
jgi:hypothetical protein